MTILTVDVDDTPGVLTRVASLFRRRAFNIESLTVGRTDVDGVSRMTIVVEAEGDAARRVEAHLHKLVNVIRVENVTAGPTILRDLAMIKVTTTGETRAQVMQLAEVFRARVVDVSPGSVVIEITGTEDKVDGLVEVLRPYGVLEMARTGQLAMRRGTAQAASTVSTDESDLNEQPELAGSV